MLGSMKRPESVEGGGARSTRDLVLSRLSAAGVEVLSSDRRGRYVLVTKIDDDSQSDRRASFRQTEIEVRAGIVKAPPGWWPDCVIDLDAPVAIAVRDAAAGDGSLGEPYSFDAENVIFA